MDGNSSEAETSTFLELFLPKCYFHFSQWFRAWDFLSRGRWGQVAEMADVLPCPPQPGGTRRILSLNEL